LTDVACRPRDCASEQQCFADGTLGIELKATLKTRKLLILLNAKNAKNSEFAQVRYTAGTRTRQRRKVGRTGVQASKDDSTKGSLRIENQA
jgi:hypothetical protein